MVKMPSLKVSKSQQTNTFEHFYQSFTKRASRQSVGNSNGKLCLKLFMNVSAVVLCCWVCLLWSLVMFYYFNYAYINYYLYYLRDWVWLGVGECIFTTLIVYLFFNSYYKRSFKWIVFNSFLVCCVVNGTIMTILLWEYKNENYIWHLNWYCAELKHWNSSLPPCKSWFSLFELYINLLNTPLCLLSVVLMNICAYYCCKCTRKTSIAKSSAIGINYKEMNLLSSDEFTKSGSDHSIDVDVDYFDGKVLTDDKSYSNSWDYNSHIVMLMLILSCIAAYFLFNGSLYLIYQVVYWYCEYTDKYIVYFYSLLLVTSSFKIIIKFIARRIDICNMNASKQTNNGKKWYNFVSMEILTEFIVNMNYFIIYYGLFIIELWNTNVSKFIQIIILHILSELFQSTIRLSKIYFDTTIKICNKLSNYNCNCGLICNEKSWFFTFLLNRFDSDSTFNEWRIRHSIDMAVRFITLLIVMTYNAIIVWIKGYNSFDTITKSEFESKLDNFIIYMLIVFGCDLFYFLFVFLFHFYLSSFNIFQPFLLMNESNWKVIAVTIVISMLYISYW